MDLKKDINETPNHFMWRVYKYRNDTGKIDNKECGKICRRELGKSYDESAFRKKLEYFFDVWRDVSFEYISDTQIEQRLLEIEDREDDLYKLKVRTRDALREKRNLLTAEGRIDELKEYIRECFRKSDDIELELFEKKFVGIPSKNALLAISDWHIGLECKNFWNTCNLTIIKDRVEKLYNYTVKYCVAHGVNTIYVTALGDMISGSIHVTTRVAEEIDTLEQSRFAGKLIWKLLYRLSDYGFKVKYSSVVGNHDRKNKNFKEHIEKESFNKMIDWYIEDKIEDSESEIEFIYNEIDDGISLIDVDGDKFVGVHGHQDKLTDVIDNMSRGLETQIRGVLCAHWHHKVTDTKYKTKLFVNGTLSGLDEYNKGRRFWTVPSQSLIIIDDKNTIDIDIILE